jgi:DNA/RNA endonuclease YhcR with UshA esterase domain
MSPDGVNWTDLTSPGYFPNTNLCIKAYTKSTVLPKATHFSVKAPSSATMGTAVSFTVTALDANGNTVTGYTGTVKFTSSDSSATLPANSTLTNGTGTFSATFSKGGSQTITATDTVTGITGASNSISVSGAATHFGVSAPATATVTKAFPFTVTALDANGFTVAGYSGTVVFSSTDTKATLPANSTLTNGTGTFSATLNTAGSKTITATDKAKSTMKGSSGAITVSNLPATHFTVVSASSSATTGTALSFTVTALDVNGKTVTGYSGTVQITSTDKSATLPPNSKLTNGVKTFSVTFNTAGSQTITATDTVTGTITGISGPITVSGLPATHFTVSAPTSATAGTAFNFTVTALDAKGHTATGYSGTVKFSSTDKSATLPGNSTLTNGTGTFSATLFTAGSRTITATDTKSVSLTGTSKPVSVVTLSISGTVTIAAGKPAAGVLMTLSNNATCKTTAGGSYTFSNLASGTYTVTPSEAGYTFTPPSSSFPLTSSKTGVNFTRAP